jgi:uncharacterized protein YqeY
MLTDILRARAAEATKSKNTLAAQILRLALGEIQTAEARAARPLTEDEAVAVVRKLVKSNEETLSMTTSEEQKKTLRDEIAVLSSVLPATLGPEQIAEKLADVKEAIKAAANDGQAMGIAMKHLKSAGIAAQGADVSKAVKAIRS